MALFEKILGTASSTFKIGKDKLTIIASGLTAPRNFTMPDAAVDLSGGSNGQVLTKISSVSIGWTSPSGGTSAFWRSFSRDGDNLAASNVAPFCTPMLVPEACTISLAKVYMRNAPASDCTFDIKKNGVSILSSVMTVLAGQNLSSAASFSSTAIAANDILEFYMLTGTGNYTNCPIKFT